MSTHKNYILPLKRIYSIVATIMNTQIKKRIVLFILLLGITTSLSAITIATYATLESRKGGGGVELGYIFYENESFQLQHHAALNLYLGNDVSVKGHFIALSNKIVFASLYESTYKTYGFARVEGGFAYDKNHSLFDPPFILEIGGGAGFEFRFVENNAFFSEFGGGTTFLLPNNTSNPNSDFSGSYVLMTVGMRHYL